ncbi:2'-5' RNA ligase family protein [Brevibacillus dissolubilis]|uniref:2'-5' RNA ligase family protein n=1 Tax=Brevibacillus dissolubilis TaxID=1844116 RepID=UPI0011169117|nr:2'-5' RNA ligase family protein [Brevibacillus dissolubilis]
MKYSVVIFPSSKVQEIANSYRKRYDPTYATIPPFMRLKEAFELDEANLPELVAHLQQVADSTEAFTLNFHRVGTFHPTTNVIYFSVQEKDTVTALHDKLNEGCLSAHKETFAFVPHLTIGRDLPSDELKDVVGQLGMTKLDLQSEIDRIHLVYQLEDGVWNVHQTFLLKKV